jgi:hypothetical protein
MPGATRQTRKRRARFRHRVARDKARGREWVGTALHLERADIVLRIPMRIQRPLVVAGSERQVHHVIRDRLRRLGGAHRQTGAQNLGLIAICREIHVADNLHCHRLQRFNRHVLVRRGLFGRRRRVVRRRELGLRHGDLRAERRERDGRCREIRVARQRGFQVVAGLDRVQVRHIFECEFNFRHNSARDFRQVRHVIENSAAVIRQTRCVVEFQGDLPVCYLFVSVPTNTRTAPRNRFSRRENLPQRVGIYFQHLGFRFQGLEPFAQRLGNLFQRVKIFSKHLWNSFQRLKRPFQRV